MTQDEIIRMAKEACAPNQTFNSDPEWLERFAALVRADVMNQVMDTCEAEYKLYDEMVEQDDAGHEESCALIHLMRKLEKLK